MPYDEQLANRIRPLLEGYPATEKKMFGGIAFMVNGYMCCGVSGSNLVVRTGPDGFEDALARPHARPMDFTGRPVKGFVYVAPQGYRKDTDLQSWTRLGLEFVLRRPPK
jgi:hypothetical protein